MPHSNGAPPATTPRRVVVTGGARGIGFEIAATFARLGDRVALVDVLADDVELAAKQLEATPVVCDLGDPAQVRAAMSSTIERLGGIDVLVNNAGIFRITPLLEISVDEWDEMFTVNVRSMLLTIQVGAQAMIAQGSGGRIVNMASMGGKVAAAGQAHYAASKAAVISLTQSAAKELGPHGVNANCLCPGYVLTDMGASTRTQEQIDEWSSNSPLGRLAEPADVAGFVRFLASPEASYLTGQAFNVTGGMITH